MNSSNYSSKCELYTKLFSLSIDDRRKIIHLCDRLVFEYERHLRDYEIKALSRISMLYQGKATDRELSMIADICDRVGIAGGVR